MNNKKIIKSKLCEQNVDGKTFLKFIKEINYKNKGKHLPRIMQQFIIQKNKGIY